MRAWGGEAQYQCLAAAGLSALVIALVCGGFAWPVLGKYNAYRAHAKALQGHLTEQLHIAATQDATERQLALVQRSLAGRSSQYVQAATATLAGAVLRERLKAVVEKHGGSLVSTQTVPAESEGPFPKVTIKARITSDVRGLPAIFHSLEAEQPLLFVDNLSIRSRMQRRAGNVTENLLDANFDLSGFMRGNAGSQ